MELVERLIDRLYSKIDDQDNYIEGTEKFILDQLNQEIDQIRDEIASHIIDIEAKIETINKLDWLKNLLFNQVNLWSDLKATRQKVGFYFTHPLEQVYRLYLTSKRP